MSKTYRFSVQIPACVTVDAIGRVDSAVTGSSAPLALMTNCSVIACGKMRSVFPIGCGPRPLDRDVVRSA
jgi:hypothetical protein